MKPNQEAYRIKVSYESQLIDCNCSDCVFMIRNSNKLEKSMKEHHKSQLDYFTVIRQKLIDKARWYKERFYDLEKWDLLMTEAEKMKFQFDKTTCSINYGLCDKFKKDVTFIPNTCQLHTRNCFIHRKDNN